MACQRHPELPKLRVRPLDELKDVGIDDRELAEYRQYWQRVAQNLLKPSPGSPPCPEACDRASCPLAGAGADPCSSLAGLPDPQVDPASVPATLDDRSARRHQQIEREFARCRERARQGWRRRRATARCSVWCGTGVVPPWLRSKPKRRPTKSLRCRSYWRGET